jgi:hypothetical protein
MKPYTKRYLDSFGYEISDPTEFVPCEVCGSKGVDVAHIKAIGMGGSKLKDNIENIQMLCRGCHMEYGDKTQHMAMLYALHMDFMEKSGVKFDREWILGQIEKYSET